MREERTFINIDDGITVYVSDQKLKITAPINGRNVTIEFGKANGSSFHSLGVEIAKFFEVYTRTVTHWGEQHQVTLEHKVGLTENIFNKDLISNEWKVLLSSKEGNDDNTDAPTITSIHNIGDKRSYFSDMGDQNLSSQGGFDQSSYDANEGFGAPDTAAIDAAIAAEAEAARIAAEEEAARQKAAEEAARQKAVEEEAARIAAEEAARQRELEEQSARQKAAEEAKKKKQSQDNNSDSGNKGGSGVSWTNSTTDSDWHSTVGGNYPPVLIDLDGDGDITIIHYEDSTILFDGDGDGFGNRAAWVGPQDGFLAYDKDEDGIIRDHDELSFLSYLEGAKTDLEGLAYFDTNQNGLLDQDDDAWHQFHIFQDFNSNGITDEGELTPLDEMEIISLALTSDGNARYNDSAYIYGETSFTKSDGTTIAGFDTALEISRTGYALQNFADSVLQLMKDADGRITRAVTYSDDDDHSLSLTDDNNVSSVIGGEGADIFTNDRQAGAVLMGRGGDDVLQGNVGQDILQGGQGDDRLAGGAGNDIYLFNRGDGHDVIYDESSLAEGGDTILFGPDIAASDIMLRRDGWDMVIYLRDEEDPSTDMVDLSDSLRIAAWGFTAHRIETLQFSDGAHIDISDVDGTITDEVLLGDLLEFVSNNADEDPTDSVWYNHQRHYIWSPMAEIRQDTWLVEGDGKASLNSVVHWFIHGIDKVNTLYGGGGRDHLYGRNGSDHVYGRAGNDAIYGHDGHDYLFGGDGGDSLYGCNGNDHLFGGAGNDLLQGCRNYDVLEGGAGNDRFLFSTFEVADIVTDYGNGNDYILVQYLKLQNVRIATGHGQNIRENNYGDNAVEDTILYDNRGTADHSDDVAFAILIDYSQSEFTMTEGYYLTIA